MRRVLLATHLVSAFVILLFWVGMPTATTAAEKAERDSGKITVTFRDTPIAEIYEMLSRQGRVNILLGKDVAGEVSVNLYNVTLEEAIHTVADAMGYVVEKRAVAYLVLKREEAGKDSTRGNTEIRTFKVQYTDPALVSELLAKHLSRYGKITNLSGRGRLVVEDLPEFLARVEEVLAQVDVEPRQILIQAKILEVTLRDDEAFGIDWTFRDGDDTAGTRGLAIDSDGFFLDLLTPDVDLLLTALTEKGRVRTLSTPKLLVLEDQEAEVVVGDRIGFKLTTIIDQVTTESIEFLESGVILRVKAAVDRADRILLNIHPEVSTATVTDGIPSLATTEVTTQLLAEDGQDIFIGGLIKNGVIETRKSAPVLGDLPVVGALFSRRENSTVSTETVVLITPRLVDPGRNPLSQRSSSKIGRFERSLSQEAARVPNENPSQPKVARPSVPPVAHQQKPKYEGSLPPRVASRWGSNPGSTWMEDGP